MELIDTARAERLYAAMGPAVEISGGSAANTLVGVASFGGRAAFIGRVADDELGAVFGHDIRAAGVDFRAKPPGDGEPSGRCLIVVTPDAQRTMNTFLGASAQLGPDDVDDDLVARAQVTLPRGLPVGRAATRRRRTASPPHRARAGNRVAFDALRRVLRRPPPRRVPRPRSSTRSTCSSRNEAEITSLYEVDDVRRCAPAGAATNARSPR